MVRTRASSLTRFGALDSPCRTGCVLGPDELECFTSEAKLIGAQQAAVFEVDQTSMDRSGPRELGEIVDVRRDEDAILLQSTREDVDVRRAQQPAIANVNDVEALASQRQSDRRRQILIEKELWRSHGDGPREG
jgi:hypothetical protein